LAFSWPFSTTAQSPLYSQPIAAKGTISLRVFNQSGRGGRTVKIRNEG
jgi:hexosaminidase